MSEEGAVSARAVHLIEPRKLKPAVTARDAATLSTTAWMRAMDQAKDLEEEFEN